MTNTRWQFWRRRSAEPDSPETVPEVATETVSSDRGRRWWRFGRRTASDTPPMTDAIIPEEVAYEDVAGSTPAGKRRWWQRSRAAVPETEPRPLNPDGTLPPDLLEQLNAQQTTGMNRAVKAYLQRFLVQVAQADARGNTAAVVSEVDDKLEHMNRGKLTEVWQKVQLLGKLMRDPAAHWQSKAVALASLIYVVSPIDAIPDVIPGLGLADDVAVVVTVVSYLGSALNRYAQTELKQQLEDYSDREIKKHLLKNRISLLYAAAAAALVLVLALLIQNFG